MSRGYNWRNTLTDLAAISATLAGFSIAFIGLILGWSIADVTLYQGITFGNLSVLMFGVCTALFTVASEFFIHAKNFDVFALTKEYRDWLQDNDRQRNWNKIWIASSEKMIYAETLGRYFYNASLYLLFIGLFFAIVPYNFLIAVTVSALGIVFESIQFQIQSYGKKELEQIDVKENEKEGSQA